MAMKGIARRLRPLEILTEEKIMDIHRATLDVLWETGIKLEHKKALRILKQNGCKVDFENYMAYFPPGLVEESLRKCPSTFHIKARDSKHDLVIGGNTTYFAPFPGMYTIDLESYSSRQATRREFYDGVKIYDALETVNLYTAYTPYFGFEGVPPLMAMLESFAAKARNSTKIQMEGYSHDCEIFTIQMAQALATEMYLPCLPAPPLTYYGDAIEAGLRAVEAGFPVKVGDGCIYGATAPATLAGATITNNAEIIAPIVLFQAVKPGSRIIASNFNFPQNMRTGAPAFGAIEVSLHTVVFNQIWRWYGVPTANVASGPGSAKQIDYQLGYEKAMNALLFALSGGHIIVFHGGIYGEITHHPVQAILDEDVAGMIGRFLQGTDVNEETLAVDLINKVGPVPGHYLDTEHTRNWWKKEHFVPRVADRSTYTDWERAGKKGALDNAKARMAEILSAHKPVPLTAHQESDVERILNEAREYYRKKNLISDEEWKDYMKSLESAN